MHRHAFEQVLELNCSTDLGEDCESVRIPLDQRGADLHKICFVHLELGTVHDGVTLFLATFLVHDGKHTVAIHRNEEALLVPYGLQLMELDRAGVFCFEACLFGHAARSTADVERTHGELGSGLTDRLRRDDANCFANLDQLPGREVSAVAPDTCSAS